MPSAIWHLRKVFEETIGFWVIVICAPFPLAGDVIRGDFSENKLGFTSPV